MLITAPLSLDAPKMETLSRASLEKGVASKLQSTLSALTHMPIASNEMRLISQMCLSIQHDFDFHTSQIPQITQTNCEFKGTPK